MVSRVVAVSAGLWLPSKTTALAKVLLSAIADEVGLEPVLVELGPIAAELGGTLVRDEAPPAVGAALEAAEGAAVLIAATPVFRGAYSGHFKHFFDLVNPAAFAAKPVILAASGGGAKHCLVVEHHLRPLFAFFQALSLPTSVYASDGDFERGELTSREVLLRVRSAALEAARLLGASSDPVESNRTSRERVRLVDEQGIV